MFYVCLGQGTNLTVFCTVAKNNSRWHRLIVLVTSMADLIALGHEKNDINILYDLDSRNGSIQDEFFTS
jgi:hypothetical protein